MEGPKASTLLWQKFQIHGPGAFFEGIAASLTATFVSHLLWFGVHNQLQAEIPKFNWEHRLWGDVCRNGLIGFCSSVTTDVGSNSIRVLKTAKQTARESITYGEVVRRIVATDGIQGIFLRGLGTRVLVNGVQGFLFSILWKGIQEVMMPDGPVQMAVKT